MFFIHLWEFEGVTKRTFCCVCVCVWNVSGEVNFIKQKSIIFDNFNVCDDWVNFVSWSSLIRQYHGWPNGKYHAGQRKKLPMALTRMFACRHVVDRHHTVNKKKTKKNENDEKLLLIKFYTVKLVTISFWENVFSIEIFTFIRPA